MIDMIVFANFCGRLVELVKEVSGLSMLFIGISTGHCELKLFLDDLCLSTRQAQLAEILISVLLRHICCLF